MKRVAIIDIGSKSIKFFVGERCEDGSIATLMDTNNIAALGEGGLCLNCEVCTYPNCGFGK